MRVLKRETTIPDGSGLKQTVKIGLENSTENLTTGEAKLFYIFLDFWEKQGSKKDGVVYTSLHKLFNTLATVDGEPRPKTTRHGNWSKAWLSKKLRRMISVPIVYEFAYKNKDGTYRKSESCTLLSNTDVYERKLISQHQKFFDFSHFTIHPVIVRSLLEDNTKPVRLDVLLRLRGETAVILYRFLDLILFDKAQYERNIVELAKELDFGASRRNDLLRQLRQACEELEGKDLSSGRIEFCRVGKTESGRGWKLIVRKGKQRPALSVASPAVAAVPSSDFDRAAAEGEPLMDYLETLPVEEQAKIKSSGDEIFRTKYGIGGDLTRRLALLDAIRAHQTASASHTVVTVPVSEN